MTKLIIGEDAIEVKAAKRKVLLNLRLLNSWLQGLSRSSRRFDALHALYSEKVEEQLNILQWLEGFIRVSTCSADLMMHSLGILRVWFHRAIT